MASSSLANQSPSRSRFQHSASFERRPKLLKDFLRNDSFNSSSSKKSTVQLVPSKSNKPSNVLLRSRSKRTISALHKVISVVKFFPFASVKSPLVIPRSFSRKRNTRDRNGIAPEVSVPVKVKDILRWRSFRDLAEEKSTPLDFPLSSPNRSTTSSTSCSKTSSWCDSDFTAEELPFWHGENEHCMEKNFGLANPSDKIAKLRNPKGGWPVEESDDDYQQSPVSVLETFYPENEGCLSPFHRSLANIQRTKCNLTRRIQEFEALINFTGENEFAEKEDEEMDIVAKEKAEQLLSHVNESTSAENGLSEADYDLILDFFIHELSNNEKINDAEFESRTLRIVKSWMNGECDHSYEWEMEDKREAYVKDMEKEVEWKTFKQEQEEISNELEVEIWQDLIDDLLEDFSY